MLSPYPESPPFTSSPLNTYPPSSSQLKYHFPGDSSLNPPSRSPVLGFFQDIDLSL